MPDSTPRDAVHTMRRQLRRVRWRKNLYELQRALYLLIAIAAAGVAAVVVLALGAGETLFAAAAGTATLLATILSGWAVLAAGRRWLGAARAPWWIDRQAGLRGLLATLVELERRAPAPAGGAFLPLLVERNARRLPSWEPEAVLPDVFPRGALATALVATCVLMIALAVAPRLEPPLPGAPSLDVSARRLTPGMVRGAVPLDVGDRLGPDERAAPLRLAGALQEDIRRRLWGHEWQRARQSLAGAGRGGGERPSEPAVEDGLEPSWEIARPAGSRPPWQAERGGAAPGEASGRTRSAESGRPARGAGDGTRQPAGGAGGGSDPNLFGSPTAPARDGATFELPIAARVHARGGGPRPPAGDEAPPPARDLRPELADGQRRDIPVLRMEVPPAYEEIVRRVFAHGGREAVP